jgi:putative aldouronate transport system substrate-binding protein
LKSSKKNITSMILVTAMAATATAGCSNANVENSAAGNAPQSTGQTGKLPLTEQKVTLDYLLSDHATQPINATDPVLAELQKRTNVSFNFLKTAEGYNDKFKITLASGKLPDLLYAELVDAKKYGPEGAFMPLDDLLKKYGPNILKTIKDRGIEKDLKAADGKIYALPKLRESPTGGAFMVRKDLLDQYGIKVPDTLDDYYKMLKTFKEKDPSIVPLGTKFSDLNAIFYAFGTYNSYFLKNDKMEFGPGMPEMKEALAYLNKLYSEKLLEPEFGIIASKQIEAKVSSGKVGAYTGHLNLTDFYTSIMKKDFPNAQMIPIPPLTGPDGKKRVIQEQLIGNAAVLSHDTKHAELIIKLFDYVFSDEGKLLMSYGMEGDSYEMKNGKPEYTEKMYGPTNSSYQTMFTKYAMFGRRIPVDPAADIGEQVNKGTLYADGVKLQKPHYMTPYPLPHLTFTESETDVLKSKETAVKDLSDQYMMKFIMGQESMDNWSKYTEALKKAGLDDALKIYNESYSRYKK